MSDREWAGRLPGGDPVRRAPPLLPQGGSALFQFLNTSKRSLVLDLRTDAGRASLARLLDRADVCLFEEPASVAALMRAGGLAPLANPIATRRPPTVSLATIPAARAS